MSELTKAASHEIDGFEGFSDETEGAEERSSAGQLVPGLIKFTNETTWVTRDGSELAHDRELVAVNIGRVAQRWKGKEPVETMILEPGQKFPDIEKLNAEIPKSEWVEGPDGRPRGPWQAQYLLYLLDMKTMDRFTFATSTVGGGIAVREIRDKVMWMRRFKGNGTYAVVTLSDIYMNTRFGGRQRPHFLIKRWVQLGGGAIPTEQLAVPDRSTVKESEKIAKTVEQPGLITVEKPSAKEVTGDEIPW